MAALGAAAGLGEERAARYADLVLAALPRAARLALEALMESRKYEYQSDVARKWFGEGLAKGKAEGEAEGRAEGKAEGKAEAVELLLAARGVAVGDPALATIRACRDLTRLDVWLRRASVAASAEDLFDRDE